MGRAPCCDKNNVKKGPWSPEEDAKLREFIEKHGTGGNWIALPQKAGLRRCGKSCRLRWLNYLRPNIKHGEFTEHEDRVICRMYASMGSRWSIIASQLPGRTDNDIKNYWNTKLKKKLLGSTAGAPLPGPPRQHHRPVLLPHSPSLPHHPSYNGFFTGAGSLQEPLIPTLTLPTTQDYMLSYGSLPMTNASALVHAQGAAHELQLKESSSMIVFGSDQQSCSSSDGTHSQFGHHGKKLSFDGYSYGYNGIIEQDHKLFQQQEQAQLDYNYEEIKQLLMTTSAAGLHDQEAMEGLIGSQQGMVTMM